MQNPTKKSAPTDRELFMQSLALFDRPDEKQQPLDGDVDIDAFVESSFGNVTIPPM